MTPLTVAAYAMLLVALAIAVHSGQTFLMLAVISGALGAIAVSVRVERPSDRGGNADAEASAPPGNPVHRVSIAPHGLHSRPSLLRPTGERRVYRLQRPQVGLRSAPRRASGLLEGERRIHELTGPGHRLADRTHGRPLRHWRDRLRQEMPSIEHQP
jgi:hypothetical protein